MTNLESLRSLQKRIREAKGADRELDADIAEAIGGWRSDTGDNWIGPLGQICVPSYTLDPDGLGPCVALMRMLLPGWPGSVSWNNLETNGGTSFAYVHTPIGYDGPSPWPEGSLHHNNTCLALLYAIFSAAIAKEEAKERV